MTAVAVRKKQTVGQWSSLFPMDLLTLQQSTLFMKKLLAVAISNITYLRGIFPEHAFGDRCIEDLNLKILKDDSTCTGASQVIQWVKGCFDALEKQYLRMVLIGVYIDEESPDTVLESYCFKFSYSNKGGVDVYRNDEKIASAFGSEETKKSTMRLMRMIIMLTQGLKSLPDDVYMTMKLLYYDDVTPPDYEPPGFKAGTNDSFLYDLDPTTVIMGEVETAFHTLKVKVRSSKAQFDIAEGGGTGVCNQTIAEGDKEVIDELDLQSPILEERALHLSATVPTESPAIPGSTDQAVCSQMEKERNTIVRCSCGVNEDNGLMIVCEKCNYWQHALCYEILTESQAPAVHICDQCAKINKLVRKTGKMAISKKKTNTEADTTTNKCEPSKRRASKRLHSKVEKTGNNGGPEVNEECGPSRPKKNSVATKTIMV